MATSQKRSVAKNTTRPANKSGRPGGRPPGAPVVKKAGPRDWIGGARLRTLPLAISPVALGTANAMVVDTVGLHWIRALLCLAVAIFLQIAVNYANDYSDGVRGTDKHRVGPSRLTGSGAASARSVLIVSLSFFALAGVAGLLLVIATGQYWLLIVGAACAAAGWFYTGGKKPYGYYGLGEIFVFVFFGLVATAGTTYVQAGEITGDSLLCGTAAGLFACAVLMVNNLRDRQQDKLAGKRTLSVLLGDMPSRVLFAVFVLVPYLIMGLFWFLYPNAGFTLFTLLAAVPAIIITITGKTPKEFILALQLTSLAALFFGLILAWAIAF